MENEDNLLNNINLEQWVMDKCTRCGEHKELLDFYRNKSSKDGYKSLCKPCEKGGKKVVYSKDYYRNKKLLLRYGITFEHLGLTPMMVEEQEHCDKAFSVDHNHETGDVRGLLCQHCSTGLGQFRDNTKFLAKAIQYLEDNK